MSASAPAGPAGRPGGREDQVVPARVDARELDRVGWAVDEGDVEFGSGGRAGQVRGRAAGQPDGDTGMSTAEPGQQPGQVEEAHLLPVAIRQLTPRASTFLASTPKRHARHTRRVRGRPSRPATTTA